jgi:hypothetical protein
LLENLSNNGNSGVDGVGDDTHVGLGGKLGSSDSKVTNNTSVDLEEIITGHTRLSGNTSRDNDYIETRKKGEKKENV